jgi:hypothetical protein
MKSTNDKIPSKEEIEHEKLVRDVVRGSKAVQKTLLELAICVAEIREERRRGKAL